ncbi:hypothetical protein FVE85_7941 [Porphyridium purpureum]|uniref:Uncharacterized protein n=1 Tax=Porphyridium purpureum TaxID=35688 RepID=A0A5J4YP27_PORPP|nr:hypothetical protein FVE85_7941 [Porphyridium purpureum]|eukprot:POR1405..scf295_9
MVGMLAFGVARPLEGFRAKPRLKRVCVAATAGAPKKSILQRALTTPVRVPSVSGLSLVPVDAGAPKKYVSSGYFAATAAAAMLGGVSLSGTFLALLLLVEGASVPPALVAAAAALFELLFKLLSLNAAILANPTGPGVGDFVLPLLVFSTLVGMTEGVRSAEDFMGEEVRTAADKQELGVGDDDTESTPPELIASMDDMRQWDQRLFEREFERGKSPFRGDD